jgi:hypothetical protein
VDAVDIWLATYPGSPVVLDLFETRDADAIRDRVREVVPDAQEVFFFALSVGAVYGVRRAEGERVAVKLNKLHDDPGYFADVQRVQGALRDAGFPAPYPIRVDGTTVVEEWLADGSFRDGHEPEVRRALAHTLVRLVDLATATGVRPRRPSIRPEGRLWPKPHSALFDFERSRDGAEWIDAIAAQARAVTDYATGREVVGHTDWAAKHVRFDTDLRPMAVYDWDSLATDAETLIVGNAAAAFTYTEEVEVSSPWPSPEEVIAFIADYEEARGAPFTVGEAREVRAAALFLLAYAGRCTWAYDRSTDRDALEAHAAALLR